MVVMDPSPSNGSDVRARSRKATTSQTSAPNVANGQARASKDGGAGARPRSRSTQDRSTHAGALPPFDTYPAIAIEDVQPQLDGGHWPIKRVVGDTIEVSADIFKEGHDVLQARVFWRPIGQAAASEHEAPMRAIDNDRWVGRFSVDQNTRYVYGVLAFTDVFGSWRADFQKRLAAAQDVASELLEGLRLLEEAIERCSDASDRGRLQAYAVRWRALQAQGPVGRREAVELALSADLGDILD